MSKFEANLNNTVDESTERTVEKEMFSTAMVPEKKRGFWKFLKVLSVIVALFLLIGAIGGFFYWQSLKKSPQYSLALLIDAARNDDQAEIGKLVDTDAVVDDFLPQIMSKAAELYGRGLPAEKLSKISEVVEPILPAVKDRARDELPKLIREKTDKFKSIPFWAIAIGSKSYLDITQDGDNATVISKIPNKELELNLKRNGEVWQVVGVKDEVLAQKIAEKIGQEVIAIAQKSGSEKLKDAGKSLGIKNVGDILKKAEEIFR